eukprot:8001404-Pyramimonas_sp.AAC.1
MPPTVGRVGNIAPHTGGCVPKAAPQVPSQSRSGHPPKRACAAPFRSGRCTRPLARSPMQAGRPARRLAPYAWPRAAARRAAPPSLPPKHWGWGAGARHAASCPRS